MTSTAALQADDCCQNELARVALRPQPLVPVPSADVLTSLGPGAVDGVQPQHTLGLKLEAHRRWNATLPLGFLCSVDRVEIRETRGEDGDPLVYVLEVYLSLPTSRLPTSQFNPNEESAASRRHRQPTADRPTYKLERRFADFEELRKTALSCVSMERQCSCQYCMDFLVYIRYTWSQPRGLVKLISGTEKRRQMLTTFINDFVSMGRRRAEKPGKKKRKCEAQKLVPEVLAAFLLGDALY